MAEQRRSTAEDWSDIRDFKGSNEDLRNVWKMWQTIFPEWPIELQRMDALLRRLPGQHYIHESGFCLSTLEKGTRGKIAVVAVLPEHRGHGLGTALLEKAKNGLHHAARADGAGELKSLETGSWTPRFWPKMPTDFPQEVKDFFVHRGKPHRALGLPRLMMPRVQQVQGWICSGSLQRYSWHCCTKCNNG